jgi:peptidylprolyl isomerase
MNRIKGAMNPRLLSVIAICCILVVFSGCMSQKAIVKAGDTVRVHYTASFPDGTVFESNMNGTPLEFIVGDQTVIPGFNEAVIGMSPGQTKTVRIPAEKAYGPYSAELVYTALTEVATTRFNELNTSGNLQPVYFPNIGVVYRWKADDGTIGFVRFYNITPETTTVDQNHPLAGKDLVFEITLVDIVEKTRQ